MADLKIFTENIEQEALNQINTLIQQPSFKDCKVRIMPDVHAGKGCVIGFTANLGDKVIPNIVGVDIGCGMLTVDLGQIDIDLERLDKVIRQHVPSGRNVNTDKIHGFESIKSLYCYDKLKNIDWLERSIGSLGGGNHFIELDVDEENNKFLVIHTGSRNLGKQVAEIYQKLAIETINSSKLERQELIRRLKQEGKEYQIEGALNGLSPIEKLPKELCYLIGKNREKYLHDMKICQEYASLNRKIIQLIILENMGIFKYYNEFETIHNYIDHDTNIVRKGAISAKKDELLLIPINMRDGCIIGVGKGNDDWNQSAPHGAGRIMSRTKAKELLSMEAYKETMNGIFTTSVSESTIDEAPMAYKPIEEIIENIHDTVEIVKIIKPIYNFKASE